MDLLDRYLAAVKKYLPWQRQDDIVAELKANLESQLEDREAELGRPLTQAEMEQWLNELGPPIQVAARYQPQRYLIGPTLFPFYWFVLRMAVPWALAVYAVVIVVQMFATQQPSASALLQALLRVPEVLLTTVTWVTLVFVVIEFVAGRSPALFKGTPLAGCGWSPGALPPVGRQAFDGKEQRSYAHVVAEVIFEFIFLVWLLLIPQHPFLWLGPGAAFLQTSPFQAAPVIIPFYWTVVAVNIVQWGWHVESLWRGRWQRPQVVQRIAIKAFGLIPMLVLLFARNHAYGLLKHPAQDWARYGATLASANNAIYKGLLVVCAIVVLQLLWEIGKAFRSHDRKREAARQ